MANIVQNDQGLKIETLMVSKQWETTHTHTYFSMNKTRNTTNTQQAIPINPHKYILYIYWGENPSTALFIINLNKQAQINMLLSIINKSISQ